MRTGAFSCWAVAPCYCREWATGRYIPERLPAKSGWHGAMRRGVSHPLRRENRVISGKIIGKPLAPRWGGAPSVLFLAVGVAGSVDLPKHKKNQFPELLEDLMPEWLTSQFFKHAVDVARRARSRTEEAKHVFSPS